MKRICFGFAAILLGSSLIYGSDADGNYNPFSNSANPAAAQSALTPKRTKSFAAINQGTVKQASATSQVDPFPSEPVLDIPARPATAVPERGVIEFTPIEAVPEPVEQVPVVPQPLIQEPVVEELPVVPAQPQPEPEPVVQEPVVQPPVVQEVPAIQEPVMQEPVAQEPVIQEPPAVQVQVIQVPQAIPAAQPAPAQDFSFVYAELEQFRNELAQIKKGTAKPDPKKGWSAPSFSGRIFLDSVNYMDSERYGQDYNMKNGAGFRELRLGMSGTGYDSFDYRIEFGFNNPSGSVTLMDNWIGVKNVPLLGYFRAGYYKPEVGLYYPMGTQMVTMMEYVTGSNVFGLGRRVGVSSEHLFANDRIRLFMGVFQNGAQDRNVNEDDQGDVVNVRLTTAPVFAQEGKKLLHLGGHWEYVDTSKGTAALSATPGTFSWGASSLISADNNFSNTFANDYSNRGGLELAYQNGRFSARGEVFAGNFVANGQPSKTLTSGYVELGYFLTDAFRTYSLNTGWFGAVKMNNNFHPYACGDWNLVDSLGAWQAVFQWSFVDMDDWRSTNSISGLYSGGEQTDLVLGLNWFWSPQMRMMFEYVHSEQCTGVGHNHASQDVFGTSLRYNW